MSSLIDRVNSLNIRPAQNQARFGFEYTIGGQLRQTMYSSENQERLREWIDEHIVAETAPLDQARRAPHYILEIDHIVQAGPNAGQINHHVLNYTTNSIRNTTTGISYRLIDINRDARYIEEQGRWAELRIERERIARGNSQGIEEDDRLLNQWIERRRVHDQQERPLRIERESITRRNSMGIDEDDSLLNQWIERRRVRDEQEGQLRIERERPIIYEADAIASPVVPLEERLLCTICYERKRDTLFFQCGHMLCRLCGTRTLAQRIRDPANMGQGCPECRAPELPVGIGPIKVYYDQKYLKYKQKYMSLKKIYINKKNI
jgi:hypothetical protein